MSKFEKVSFEQFKKDYLNCAAKHADVMSDEELYKAWLNIKLPKRATKGSAGYDLFAPYNFRIHKGWTLFPTGIRCQIDSGMVLVCCPKSGLGFKNRLRLANTIGIVDSDYYNSDNEGHIMAKLNVEEPIDISAGEKFMQCIFLPYGLTSDDDADGVRNGGFGSTGV